MSDCVNKDGCINYMRLGNNAECYLCSDYEAPCPKILTDWMHADLDENIDMTGKKQGMTDREARHIMENECDACRKRREMLPCLRATYCEKCSIKNCIDALLEREERSKGCIYCTEFEDLPEFYKNGEFIGRVFDTSIGFWGGNNSGWYLTVGNSDIAIAYCPMCGRPLKEVR